MWTCKWNQVISVWIVAQVYDDGHTSYLKHNLSCGFWQLLVETSFFYLWFFCNRFLPVWPFNISRQQQLWKEASSLLFLRDWHQNMTSRSLYHFITSFPLIFFHTFSAHNIFSWSVRQYIFLKCKLHFHLLRCGWEWNCSLSLSF